MNFFHHVHFRIVAGQISAETYVAFFQAGRIIVVIDMEQLSLLVLDERGKHRSSGDRGIRLTYFDQFQNFVAVAKIGWKKRFFRFVNRRIHTFAARNIS
jgi:hypothetical protein